MIRTLMRVVLLTILVVGVAAFFFGYRWGAHPDEAERPAATTGTTQTIDTSRARETGAEIGTAVAKGANEAQRAAANGAMTAKIKAKMALDDRVKALNIDIDTAGSVVTLSGRVEGDDERRRAVQLARETDGVTSVVDHLVVARR
jgi:hyperosmotically inducible periplasmic protein